MRRKLDIRKDAIVAGARDVDGLNTTTTTTTEGTTRAHHLQQIPITPSILLLGNNLPGPECQMAPGDSLWVGGSQSVFQSRAAYHKYVIKETSRYVIVG